MQRMESGTGCGRARPEFCEALNVSHPSSRWLIASALALGAILSSASGAEAAVRWVTGYYASYSESSANMPPSGVDYTALTHVIHWPVVPLSDGTLDLNNFGLTEAQSADLVARAHAVGTKAILGFGGDAATVGAGWQGATSPANRTQFIANMVSLMQTRGYDGIDINWEELTPGDGPQFTAFITELRAKLDNLVPGALLTVVPTSGSDVPVSLVAAVQQHFDQINIQTYVMSGPYPGWVTWFNSPIFNGGFVFPSTSGPVPSADDEVDRFTAGGIPVGNLAIGIQFDGAVWEGGAGTTTGGVSQPRQTWNDLTPPSMTFMRAADIIANFTPANGYTKTFDAVARVPWIGRDAPASANDRFISYDDEQAIQEKAAYIAQKGLGGVFVFEVSGDFFPAAIGDARHPLLTALRNAFRPAASAAFYAVTPCRVADTRNPPGLSGGPALAANGTRIFPAAGQCGIPSDSVAVAINVTVLGASAPGDLRLYPAGGLTPTTSTINFAVNQVRANNAIIPLGVGGQIAVQCDMPPGPGATQFLFDVAGYFK
jgi:chitinase